MRGRICGAEAKPERSLILTKHERRRANDQGGGPVFVRRFRLVFDLARQDQARIGARIS